MKKILFFAAAMTVLFSACVKKTEFKATLVEFMENGCPACESLKPVMEELKSEYKGLVDFKIYDIRTQQGSEKTGIYKLNGTPTLIFLDKNGMEYFRLEKTIQKDIIKALLNTQTGPPEKRGK